MLLLSLVWICLASNAAAENAQSTPFALQALDGRWIQRDPKLDTVARRAAIDSAIEPLSWVVRKMAGGALHTTTVPEPTLDFVWDGERLHQRLEGKRGPTIRTVEPGGPARTSFDARGEPFEGQWLWTRDGLQFRWQQHQAHGANLYRVDTRRHELTVDHTIAITALDGVTPILFRSRFVQADVPAVSAPGAPLAR